MGSIDESGRLLSVEIDQIRHLSNSACPSSRTAAGFHHKFLGVDELLLLL